AEARLQLVGDAREVDAATNDLREAERDPERAEGDDESRYPAVSDQVAVEDAPGEAAAEAHEDAERDRERQLVRSPSEHTARTRDVRHHLREADRGEDD